MVLSTPDLSSIDKSQLQVQMLMNKDFTAVSPETALVEAAKTMCKQGNGCVLVESAGQLLGIVTEADFPRKLVSLGKDVYDSHISEVMSSPVITINPYSKIMEAIELMDKHHKRRLAVVGDDGLCGVLDRLTLAQSLIDILQKTRLESITQA